MSPEWNSGASSFCPVCDSAAKFFLTLAILFVPVFVSSIHENFCFELAYFNTNCL